MSGAIERHSHISITQSTADGVTRTDVHITRMDITSSSDGSTDCFQPELVCDPEERALIKELRAYLRPSAAPVRLIARLEETLDRCCIDEDEDGVFEDRQIGDRQIDDPAINE